MKKIISVAVALYFALPALLAGPVPSWGGKYTLSLTDDAGKAYANGVLYLVPGGEHATSFFLSLVRDDGSALVYDTDNQPIPVKDGRIVFYYPDEEIDYSIEVDLHPTDEAGNPLENCVSLKEFLRSECPPYNLDLSPDGIWKQDTAVFADENGYLYRKNAKDGTCLLTRGGIYEGKITLPASARDSKGKTLKVAGIESEAFMDSRMVSQVVLSKPEEQWVWPGAFSFTTIPYDWKRIHLPFYCYPNQDKTRIAVPMEESDNPPAEESQWLIFKQNAAPCKLSEDRHRNSDLSCGRRDGNFEATQGLYYSPSITKTESNKMFRGYESYEIEALIADREFVAFHTFPSFSRWKFPEPQQNASSAVVKKVCKMYGRQSLYGKRAAWFRDGTGELDIVEFTHKDGQATVCFVYQVKGEIYATTTLSTKLTDGEEDFSVWNVDDDGTYGIPDVVSIAVDPDGYCNFFLAKNSPESVTCFILHQVEDRLEILDVDQWYRFIE